MPRPAVKPVIEIGGKLWMTVDESARRYGVTRTTIYQWFKRGLESKRIGRIRRVNVSSLHRWYRDQQTQVEEVTSGEIQAQQGPTWGDIDPALRPGYDAERSGIDPIRGLQG